MLRIIVYTGLSLPFDEAKEILTNKMKAYSSMEMFEKAIEI